MTSPFFKSSIKTYDNYFKGTWVQGPFKCWHAFEHKNLNLEKRTNNPICDYGITNSGM